MLEYERCGPGRFVRFGIRSAPFFAFRIGKKENNISEERISMNIDFESRNITRRSFLKGAGVGPQLHRCHSPQGVHLLGVCKP